MLRDEVRAGVEIEERADAGEQSREGWREAVGELEHERTLLGCVRDPNPARGIAEAYGSRV